MLELSHNASASLQAYYLNLWAQAFEDMHATRGEKESMPDEWNAVMLLFVPSLPRRYLE